MTLGPVIQLLVFVGLIGLIAWGVCQIPMPEQIKKVVIVVAIVACVLVVLNAFGLLSGVAPLRVR